MITIRPDPRNKRMHKFVCELEDRIAKLIESYPYWMANEMHKLVLGTGPKDIPGYLDKMEVQRFEHPKADHVFGLVLPGYVHSKRLKVEDVARTVLYIGQRRKARPDLGVEVLERYNPWTMDTLPYDLGKEATITSRRVTEREVNIIRERRLYDRKAAVDAELEALSVRGDIPRITRNHPTLLRRKVSRDIVFEALRREFGAPGEPHQPHLRSALSKLQRNIEPRLWRSLAVRYLSMPSEKRWQRPIRAKMGKPSIPKRVRPLQDFILGTGESDL